MNLELQFLTLSAKMSQDQLSKSRWMLRSTGTSIQEFGVPAYITGGLARCSRLVRQFSYTNRDLTVRLPYVSQL